MIEVTKWLVILQVEADLETDQTDVVPGVGLKDLDCSQEEAACPHKHTAKVAVVGLQVQADLYT